MMEVQQDSIDFIDPALPQYVFVSVRSFDGCAFIDLGDGVDAVEGSHRDILHVTPAWTESRC
jgi:hypothetical protein